MATDNAKEAPQTILQFGILLIGIGLLLFGWSENTTSRPLAIWCWRATLALFIIATIFSLVIAVSEIGSIPIGKNLKNCGISILLWALTAPFLTYVYGGIAFGFFRLIDII